MTTPTWFPRAWSPTSLAGLETCPRRWALRRAGWKSRPDPMRPPAQHARFGQLWHAAAENFDRARYARVPLAEATDAALQYVFEETWTDDAPWAGAAVELWTCRDGIKHTVTKTGKPRREFLCDGARDWWMGAPDRCPKCGGAVETETRYVPEHPTKNRATLLRAVEAYCADAAGFQLAGDEEGPILERELHFEVAGVSCHMIVDRISWLGTRRVGHERKTTARYPGKAYWEGMARSYQSAFYTIAAGVKDIVYEVVVVGAKGAEVLRQIVSPSPDVVREVEKAVDVAAFTAPCHLLAVGDNPQDFPPRFASCATAAGGQPCEFLALCNSAAAARPHRLAQDFVCEPRST